jgi:hypothetical protein
MPRSAIGPSPPVLDAPLSEMSFVGARVVTRDAQTVTGLSAFECRTMSELVAGSWHGQ